jgi:membrane fusion protein (multidrug efflux system)
MPKLMRYYRKLNHQPIITPAKNIIMENTETPKKKFNPAPVILGIVAILVIIFVVKKVTYSMHNEDTDNSQIECNINPIVPKVAGFVEEIRIKDNMYVHKGDTLIRTDDRQSVAQSETG